MSLDGYGSKIRKLSRCRPTVSNGTILATKQEFFFTNVAPIQNITDIVLLGFLLILLLYFILHYHLFFRKEFFFFSNVYISVNTIFECCYLFFSWEIGHLLSTCATGGMEGGHPKHVQVRTGVQGYHASCVRTHLLFSLSYDVLKHALSYGVLFYL